MAVGRCSETRSRLFGWSHDVIADLLIEAFAAREAALREEQAVYGLDALDETAMHPVVAQGFRAAGLGVLREQPYPTQWKRKRGEGTPLPLPRDRERCDIVLTQRTGQSLRDSLAVAKSIQTERDAAAGTLFATLGTHDGAGDVARAINEIDPEDAYWLEFKVVAQYSVESGVPGPNRAYGSQLSRFAASDIGKLSADRMIVHGGLALVLFTADEAVAAHDAGILVDRLIGRGLRVGSPTRRCMRVLDRIGNAFCTVVLIPLRPAPPLDE